MVFRSNRFYRLDRETKALNESIELLGQIILPCYEMKFYFQNFCPFLFQCDIMIL